MDRASGGISGEESTNAETHRLGLIPGLKPLGVGMATHSSGLTWEISMANEPGRPQSMELQKRQTQLSD